jgi:hypothetical protein
MRPERQRARQQRDDGRRSKRDDQPPADALLPGRLTARKPLAAEQGTDDDGETDVLDGHRYQPQDAEEPVVHHFTLNVYVPLVLCASEVITAH